MKEFDYEAANTEAKYYSVLWNFANVVEKVNKLSFEGYAPERIATKMRKVAPALFNLCMAGSIETEKEYDLKKMTDGQIIVMIRNIVERGNNAEVRQNREGELVVYEVKKHIVSGKSSS